MIPLTLAEITAITSGTLHHVPDPSAQVTGPPTCESRQVTRGGMFAALPGARAGMTSPPRHLPQVPYACWRPGPWKARP
jgi:hypothetical protein